MRQLSHKLVGVLFWVLMVGLWAIVISRPQAGTANITYSVRYVAIVSASVLLVTVVWIRHNINIHRRKGPRHGRPATAARLDEDRLERPLTWAMRGGHDQARGAHHLVVDIEDGRKVYRRA